MLAVPVPDKSAVDIP